MALLRAATCLVRLSTLARSESFSAIMAVWKVESWASMAIEVSVLGGVVLDRLFLNFHLWDEIEGFGRGGNLVLLVSRVFRGALPLPELSILGWGLCGAALSSGALRRVFKVSGWVRAEKILVRGRDIVPARVSAVLVSTESLISLSRFALQL